MKKEEYLTPEFDVASIVFQDIMEANDSDPESRIIRDDNIPVVSG
ncbi:MAG: hypothetical protein Q3989_03690 [Eubacteriales bacterium]|nr:hypothetical protein [uncultured Ruminococcus sp.]MDO4892384.1 hypothetical protein [Eubacteriales bacterium]